MSSPLRLLHGHQKQRLWHLSLLASLLWCSLELLVIMHLFFSQNTFYIIQNKLQQVYNITIQYVPSFMPKICDLISPQLVLFVSVCHKLKKNLNSIVFNERLIKHKLFIIKTILNEIKNSCGELFGGIQLYLQTIRRQSQLFTVPLCESAVYQPFQKWGCSGMGQPNYK